MEKERPALQTGKEYFHITYTCTFGVYYEVVEESKQFFAIYASDWGDKRFITHRTNQKNACRVAELLQDAFLQGLRYREE